MIKIIHFQTKHHEIIDLLFLMQLQSNLVPLHLSIHFIVNSPWHCASFTKQHAPINPLTRSGTPLEINYPLVPYAAILLISVQKHERAVSTKHVKAQVLSLHLSETECVSIYCLQCRQDSSRDCNLYLLHQDKPQPLVRRWLFIDVLLWRQFGGMLVMLSHTSEPNETFYRLIKALFIWGGSFKRGNLQDVLMVQRPLLC